MLVFFEILLKICFFKAKPQDLPAGRQWMIISTALIIGATILASLSKESSNQIVMFALTQVALYALIIWIILKLKGVQSRWLQTITALFGTSFLLQLIAIPFSGDINTIDSGTIKISNALLVIFIISIWNLFIVAFILKQALENSFFAALVLAFFAQAISLTLALSFVGAPAVDPALTNAHLKSKLAQYLNV